MILITIWPIFAIICAGFVMAQRGFPEQAFWPAAEKVNYFLLFPALLVSSLANAPIRDPALLQLGLAAALTIGVATAGLAIYRRIRPMPAARFGPAVQGVVRINTYLGLAITAGLAGQVGLGRAAVLLAFVVPLVNVISIIALTDEGPARQPRRMIAMMLRNPLIIACIIGIFVSATGLGLPFGLGRFFALLGQGSLPLGLLCVGAALRPAALRQDWRALSGNSAVRLLAMPVLALGVARVFGLGEVETLVLVIFSAIPTAPTAYVLTRQFGGDGTFMAGLVTAQTMASVVTIPVMLLILGLG